MSRPHRCRKPFWGVVFFQWREGMSWHCDKCDRIWRRYETYAGAGWENNDNRDRMEEYPESLRSGRW